MTADLDLPVEVVGCPLVREPDGLAMSSRNAYLSDDERAAATILSAGAVHGVGGGGRAASATRPPSAQLLVDTVAHAPLVRLDYAEVVDAATLDPVDELDRRHAGCTGRVRGQGSSDRQRHDHVPRADALAADLGVLTASSGTTEAQ